jgi:hypothetical protein
MKRYVSSHWFIGVLFTLAVSLVGTIALRSSRGAGQDQIATIVNQTDSLKVEDLKITDPRPGEKQYNFTLRNISSKQMVAWAILYPSGQTQIVGTVIGGGLAPGETYATEVYDTSGNRVSDKKITIALAMFADGSSEGDFKLHKQVTDSREGSRIQLERINAIIEKALADRKASPNQIQVANEKEWLNRITLAIAELPETGPPDKPNMSHGMNSVKQEAIRLIGFLGEWEETRHNDPVRAGKTLKQSDVIFGASNVQEGLAKVVGDNKRKIAKGVK